MPASDRVYAGALQHWEESREIERLSGQRHKRKWLAVQSYIEGFEAACYELQKDELLVENHQLHCECSSLKIKIKLLQTQLQKERNNNAALIRRDDS